MSVVSEYWPLVLETLKSKVSESNYRAWFAKVEFVSLDNQGRKVILSVPSAFHKKYIENKFKKVFQESINKYYPQVIHIDYRIDVQSLHVEEVSQDVLNLDLKESEHPIAEKKSTNTSNKVDENHPKYLPAKSINSLNPKYTFDSFVVTKNNEMAANVAGGVVQELGKLYNPLFVYSKVGLGKTHLIQSVGNKVLENQPNLNIKYLPAETFVNQFILSLQNRETSKFRDYYKDVDVLLVDDIQFLAGKESTQEQFFHIFNELQQANKQIVITSDRSPQEIVGIEDRLVSRFSMGMVVDISGMDLEDRLAIIEDKILRAKLPLTTEQARVIAEVKVANVREIEGILNKVKARISFLPNRNFSDEDLEIILQGFVANTDFARVGTGFRGVAQNIKASGTTPERIIDAVCKLFTLQKSDILGSSRQKDISLARQIIFWLYKNDLDLSYPVIGKMLGDRDHSTVMHGCRKIEELSRTDLKVKQKIELTRQNIQN